MRIALTGATGFVGSWLAEELIHDGHELTCLVRPTSNLHWIQHLPLRKVVGDVTDRDSLADFVEGQDILIHAAGVTKARTEEEYLRANAQSTQNLLEVVLQVHPHLKRFVLISSQAAAGPSSPGAPKSEEAPPEPLTAYGRSKLAAERIALKYRDQIPVTIIRPPAVYGPRDRDVFAYFRLANWRLMPLLGKNGQVSVVFVRNLTYGIRLAMDHPRAVNEIYFLTDDGTFSWRQLGQMIAEAVGKHAVPIRVPMVVIRFLAGLSQIYSNLTRRAVLLNREKLLEIRQPYWTLSIEKAKRELGYSPPYTTREAIHLTAQWYREQGWL